MPCARHYHWKASEQHTCDTYTVRLILPSQYLKLKTNRFIRHNHAASSSPPTFSATTNADGRVTSWQPSSTAPFTTPVDLETLFKQEGDQRYSLTFNTEEYFGTKGVKTFFPEVEVKFVIRAEQKGEHFHVPVLVGGFGYSTYRGS
jgi:5-hydroxyisourate hydrolase